MNVSLIYNKQLEQIQLIRRDQIEDLWNIDSKVHSLFPFSDDEQCWNRVHIICHIHDQCM